MVTTSKNLTFYDSNIIEMLGGTKKVAKMCNVAESAVTHWKTRGIPHGHLLFLAYRLEKQSFGLITRKDLFPNNYKLIWPELE